MEFKLSTPITHGGETINTLTLRTPTGTDLFNYGMPIVSRRDSADPENTVVEQAFDTRSMFKWVSALADISPNAVQKIAVEDLVELFQVIAGFFTKSETPTT